MTPADLHQPAGVELGRASVDGVAGARLMVILRAPGCAFARRTGGCTNCGFWQHLTSDGAPVPDDAYVSQLRAALEAHAEVLADVVELDLFCSGSLLCDGEVSPEARRRLLALAADRLPALRAVLVESRPEYISPEALRPLIQALAGSAARLEVGIGLESADREIREERIRKGFTLEQFEAAARALSSCGPRVGLLVYLLLKPLGTGDAEAALDVLRSGRYLNDLARELGLAVRIALEPTFVPEQTELYEELVAGRYAPPSLWLVAAVTRKLREEFDLPVHVGLSSEGLPARQVPSGCPLCAAPLRAALARFTETQDPHLLASLRCKCQAE